MLVSARCPGCQSVYRLPDRLSGKKVRCKGCSATFKVPAAVADPAKQPVLQPVAAVADFEDSIADSASDEQPALAKSGPSATGQRGKPDKPAKTRKRFPVMLVAIVAIGLFVGAAGAYGVWFMWFSGPTKHLARPITKPAGTTGSAVETEGAKNGKPALEEIQPPDNGKPAADDVKEKAPSETGGAKAEKSKGKVPGADEVVSFTEHIKPFLTTYCGKCHMNKQAKGGLSLTSLETMKRGGKSKRTLIVPNEPDKSLLVLAVEKTGKPVMPPGKEKLQPTEAERNLLRRWIAAGAVDDSPKSGASLRGSELRLPAQAVSIGPDRVVAEQDHFHDFLAGEDVLGQQQWPNVK